MSPARPRTVERHVAKTLAKLGVKDRPHVPEALDAQNPAPPPET
ncbi:hypothetical protein AB0M39_01480 [Streptomyces sp. NPDC051907]